MASDGLVVWARPAPVAKADDEPKSTIEEDGGMNEMTKTIADAEAEEARDQIAKLEAETVELRKRAQETTTIRKAEDMSTSTPTDGITTEARGAIARAVSILQPYAAQDGRIAGLVTKLQAVGGSVSKADRLAADLAKVNAATAAVIKADGPMSLQDRAQNANATREAQAAYLREVGGNVDAWDRGRAA
jgi:hypothetical protein